MFTRGFGFGHTQGIALRDSEWEDDKGGGELTEIKEDDRLCSGVSNLVGASMLEIHLFSFQASDAVRAKLQRHRLNERVEKIECS